MLTLSEQEEILNANADSIYRKFVYSCYKNQTDTIRYILEEDSVRKRIEHKLYDSKHTSFIFEDLLQNNRNELLKNLVENYNINISFKTSQDFLYIVHELIKKDKLDQIDYITTLLFNDLLKNKTLDSNSLDSLLEHSSYQTNSSIETYFLTDKKYHILIDFDCLDLTSTLVKFGLNNRVTIIDKCLENDYLSKKIDIHSLLKASIANASTEIIDYLILDYKIQYDQTTKEVFQIFSNGEANYAVQLLEKRHLNNNLEKDLSISDKKNNRNKL